jgi:hypothetical protein
MSKTPSNNPQPQSSDKFLNVAHDLEVAGLLWHPEVGDEVADREGRQPVAILVDPQGMTPTELRQTYLWLPTVEQIIYQFEARQAVLFHAGFELTDAEACYKTVIQASFGHIESRADSFRVSLGLALRDLLLTPVTSVMN